jgi:hypothetical protein
VAEPVAPQLAPTADRGDAEALVRAAYRDVADGRRLVGLADLRDRLGDLDRASDEASRPGPTGRRADHSGAN